MEPLDDGEELVLFGAPRGEMTRVVMTVTPPDATSLGRVDVTGSCIMRKQDMRLIITSLRNDQMAMAIGYCVPLMTKCYWVNGDAWKASCWQVFRRLGIAGWEVDIKGCGKGR